MLRNREFGKFHLKVEKKCLTYSDQDGRASSKDRSEAGTFLPSLLRQNRIRNRFRIRNSGFRTRWRPSCLNYFASSSKSPFLTLKMLLSVELKIGEIPFTLTAGPSETKGQGIKKLVVNYCPIVPIVKAELLE